jgi:hypothetical protein
MFKSLPTSGIWGRSANAQKAKKKEEKIELLYRRRHERNELSFSKMAIANYDLQNAPKKRKRHVAEWAEWDEQLSSSCDTR